MSSSAAVTLFFQVVSTAGFVLAAGRLFQSGLHRKYVFFFSFLIFCFLQNTGALVLGTRSGLYLKFFILTEPLAWLFYVVVVLELYRLVLEQYPGLYTLGRWALYASIAVAVLLSLLTLIPRLESASFQKNRLLNYYLVIERGLVCSLLIFLFLILLLLRSYPVRLSRNVVVHCVVYPAFFLSTTMALLLRGLFDLRIGPQVNLFIVAFNTVCVFLWAMLLNARGEERMVSVSGLRPAQEERVMTQLNALNTTILRVSRK